MRGTKARQRGVLSLPQPWAWKFEWKVLKGEVPTVRAVQEAELSVKIYLSIEPMRIPRGIERCMQLHLQDSLGMEKGLAKQGRDCREIHIYN